MSTTDPNEADDKTLLLDALRGFVDEYDNDRGTWPDDMVKLLDSAHYAISAATGTPRRDYPGAHRVARSKFGYPLPVYE